MFTRTLRRLKLTKRRLPKSIPKLTKLISTTLVQQRPKTHIYLVSKLVLMMKNSEREEEKEAAEAAEVVAVVAVASEEVTEVASEEATEVASEVSKEVEEVRNFNSTRMLSPLCEELSL